MFETFEGQAWSDPALEPDRRVALLLAELTLEEKVGQLGSRWLGNDMQDEDTPPDADALNVAPMQDVFAASGTVPLETAAAQGMGHLTRIYGSRPVSPEEGAAELVRQQRIVVANSRLRIPAIVHEECLTGLTSYGATVYPAPLAWAATFDPELVERVGSAIGRDLAALGVHQGLAPVMDVVRDYRWGRVEETMGEDPYLVATTGAAYVRGVEGAGVIATLKHFAGYSASRGARNHGPVSMGRRELLDVVLPPFEHAIRLGGVGSVMNSYSDVDGVPAGADPWLLTEILRDAWHFDGTVVSDYWSVPFLATMHRVAADFADAGVLALQAGIDVELPDTLGFGPTLVEAVRDGRLDEAVVDRAAARILRQKVRLGLLDDGWTPEGSVAGAAAVELDSTANRALAREVAERSVVLLDPGTALPLLGDDRPAALSRVAVVGPTAADPRTFMGCYAFPNHVLPRYPGLGLGLDVPTALDALRAELPGVDVVHETGCEVTGSERGGFAAAVDAARGSDLCLAFVGDLAGLFGYGSSGEGCDADDLNLPGVQAELLAALLDTGTPVVVVVVSGRPYALGDFADRAAGLVQAFMPGEEAGAAIAGVLSGRTVPTGKLPVQIPRTPGGQPGTYLQPPLGTEDAGISSLHAAPLFPFGFGRSYTTFALSDPEVSAAEVPTDGELTLGVRVTNTGPRAGAEVVQLYLRDVVAPVALPTRRLIGYARVELRPGEQADVRFTVHTDRTAFTGRDLTRVVEPGELELLVGTSAGDLPGRATVHLTGPVRTVGHDRVLLTPVDVRPVDVRPVGRD
ncbi:glycoside hydrolase family 3 N-terminal domain-containing protein [Spongisporangium articulatum]|uniref:Glycoside hydrolase family 3 N-terminal domain-containing protein n=1 Tax=Spongisporangium articulatum TaxID=3362603 RepID=A0ABW8APA5_9ACTN